MTRFSLDKFIEAFSAQLVQKGQHRLRLNDPTVRDGLYKVYEYLSALADSQDVHGDQEWRRSLINLRNVFRPSAIGSFDRLESLLRAKQIYLTDHPNPYYQDVMIRLPVATAKRIVEKLPPLQSSVVVSSVERYLSAN